MKKKPSHLFSIRLNSCASLTRCGAEASRRMNAALIATALSAISFSAVHAASLTWNGGSSGDWDTSAANWLDGGSSVAWTQTNTAVPLNDAVFGAADGSYAVTIGATQLAANFLTFNNSGYTISGGTLYLLTSGTTTVASGKTATINSSITTGSNQLLNMTVNSGGTLNLGGGSSLIQGRFSGAGALNITAGTYSLSTTQFNNAFTNQTGGTLNMTGSSSAGQFIGYGANRSVNYTLSAGALNLNSGSAGAYLAIGRAQGSHASTLTVKDTGTVNLGTTVGNSGQINIVSNDGNGSGLLDVQGGTLTVGTGQSSNQIYLFNSGASASKTSTFQQSGGTVTTQGIQFGGGGGTYSATALAKLELTGGNLYVGSLGITKGSAAASLPVSILLNGGTLGASASWSSLLDMTLGTAILRAADAGGIARDITLSGIISGPNGITKTGGGILTLAGSNALTGSVLISGGTLAVDHLNALPPSGDITFGGGTLRFSAANTTDYSARIVNSASAVSIDTNGQNLSFATGLASTNTAGLTKSGLGTLTLTASNAHTGTTTVTGGTLSIGSSGVIGNSSSGVTVTGSSSALSINNGGTVIASGNLDLTNGGAIYLETGSGLNATAAVSGGIVTFRSSTNILTATSVKLASSGAAGTGGTMTVVGQYLRPLASNNGNHTFTFNNVNVSATASTFEVGRGGSANTVSLNNGTQMSVKDAALSTDASDYTLNVGSDSAMTLQNNTFNLYQGSGGNRVVTVNVNGGTISGVNNFSFNNANNSTVKLTNGGSIAATNFLVNNATTAPSGGSIGINILVFDNGRLTARANSTALLSGTGTVKIKNGGATIDSGAFNVTVSSALTEDASSTGGGLTKIGAGILTLTGGNSYTGDTSVSEGVLAVSGSSIPDTNKLVISGGKVNLATTSNNETVNTLSFGASPQAAGTYGSTASSATFKYDSYFSGTGVLTVLSGSGGSGFSTWITGTFANGTVPGGEQGVNDDPDRDGISNLLEYAIAGGDPTVTNAALGTFANKTLSYTKRAGTSGLTYAIEESTDLGVGDPWQEVPASPSYVNDSGTISHTLPGGPAKDFMRLKVTN